MPATTVFRSCRFCFAATAVLVMTSLAACSTFNSSTGRVAGLITPYRMEVVQGNFVSKEQKEALQIGMPRAQVRDILGSPLVASAFHADRWDYAFTIRRQGAEPQQRKLTVYFKGEELAKVESDELISEQEFVDSLSKGRTFGKPPVLEAKPESLAQPAKPAAVAPPAPTGTAPAVYPPLEPSAR
jgi:outer membrane protein assembly factor BamE